MSDAFTISGWTGEPLAIAVEDARGAHAWSTISARAERGAARLPTGARIGLRVAPGADWLASLFAIFRAGSAVVPLSARQPDAEAAALLRDAEAALIITETPLGDIEPLHPDDLLSPGPPATAPAPGPDALALLLYTSGTTGRPKGVELTHANLSAGARALIDSWGLRGRRALLHALPLHHMHGVAIALLPCLEAGMRAVMLPTFDAAAMWEALARVDTLMAVPTMYHRMLETYDAAGAPAAWRSAAASLSLSVSGSAALASRLAERWAELAGAIPLERWGMTEVGVGLSNPLDPEGRRLGRVGSPIGALEGKLVDGELLVRGPSVFARYWRRPDETAAAFDEGWFRTGDAAEVDEHGSYRILGRRSIDILKSGGFKLSALEIEEALREHPAVADAAVVGLPDEVYGQLVAAAVVPRGALDEEELRAWARERMAGYKVPRRVLLVSSLPLNPVGKVDKAKVAVLFV
jgi:malonyl-CoA/methylmalonyl-CoA synthetase